MEKDSAKSKGVVAFFDGFSGFCVKDGEFSLKETGVDDKEFYAKLFYDDELNKFWGYDYKTDDYFKGKPLSEDTAFGFMQSLKRDKEEISLIMRQGNGRVGEIVLYGFSEKDESVEIGVRISPEYQGKGLGKKGVTLATEKILKENLAKKCVARCFKQNVASRRLFLSAGYRKSGEDDGFYYFSKAAL